MRGWRLFYGVPVCMYNTKIDTKWQLAENLSPGINSGDDVGSQTFQRRITCVVTPADGIPGSNKPAGKSSIHADQTSKQTSRRLDNYWSRRRVFADVRGATEYAVKSRLGTQIRERIVEKVILRGKILSNKKKNKKETLLNFPIIIFYQSIFFFFFSFFHGPIFHPIFLFLIFFFHQQKYRRRNATMRLWRNEEDILKKVAGSLGGRVTRIISASSSRGNREYEKEGFDYEAKSCRIGVLSPP